MAAYYYKGKTVPHGVGMPGWSEMTITEGILAKCAPPLYPPFPSDRGTRELSRWNAMPFLRQQRFIA